MQISQSDHAAFDGKTSARNVGSIEANVPETNAPETNAPETNGSEENIVNIACNAARLTHGSSTIDWLAHYRRVRKQTEILCRPLCEEDFNLQAMAEVSPPKWHLAHTTWFFETLLLREFCPGYKDYHPRFGELFNSYYQALGRPFAREHRGLLSRPTLREVCAYRQAIDERIGELLAELSGARVHEILQRLQLGIQHEQQHQELLLTDIKYNFFVNPLLPAYAEAPACSGLAQPIDRIEWEEFAGGVVNIGAGLDGTFCFDNETPRHRVYLERYALGDRLVNNSDYLAFINDGGYRRPELWLADGWAMVQQRGWQAPLYWQQEGYWQQQGGRWQVFTLYGLQSLLPSDPVCHVSYYEADAFARWAGARLPTEFEWENAAASQPVEGHFIDDGVLQPRAPSPQLHEPRQLFGDVWEWTASPYTAYPGFVPTTGAVSEYNGKFMCNQMVLRGGSCASEREHLRVTYRNFFYPWDRWQFSGVRLARSERDTSHWNS